MNRWYIDSSAAIKLVYEEKESEALDAYIATESVALVSSYLLETEMRRATFRLALSQEAVTEFLVGVDLYEVPESVFRLAGLIPTPGLRSLDSIHLAAATRLKVDGILTYDTRMATAARELGFPVIAPA